MKFQTINCKFYHQGLLLNCTQLLQSQDQTKPTTNRDVAQVKSKELAESPFSSTKEAVTPGNPVSQRTETSPLNAWNSSNLTYAEVVAGLRHQRQMLFKLKDQENKSIASSNYQSSNQPQGQQVEKSIEETKLPLQTDDKVMKNKMTEGVGRKRNPKKGVQQNQLGRSESVVHKIIVENKSSSEHPAAILDECANKSYADVLKALRPGNKGRITTNTLTASNNRESSNYVVDKAMKITTCEQIVQPSQKCVQSDHLVQTETLLTKKPTIKKQQKVSKRNKQKNQASIKTQEDVLMKPSQQIRFTEESIIETIPHQQTFEAADHSKPSEGSSENRVANSTSAPKQRVRKGYNVEITSKTSRTNMLSSPFEEISIVENNLKSDSYLADIPVPNDSTLQSIVQEDRMCVDKNRTVKKYEKIRKSNSSKMAAMLNIEKMQFEKELNNGQTNIITTSHENQNDTMQPYFKQQDVAKICESPVNTFKSNLIFDDYDFINMNCDKSKEAFETDTVNTMLLGVVNNEKETKESEQIDIVSGKQNCNSQLSASLDLDSEGVISSRINGNDAKKTDNNRIQNIRWRDNRQKISMITHEEHMLKPISFIKLELPKITAEKFIYSCQKETHQEKQVYQDESNVPVEETSNLDPSYKNECVVATEISMANSSSDEKCEQNLCSYSKQILTAENSFENEEILLNFPKSPDDRDQDEGETFNKQLQTQFTTTVSSVSYKTCTIISEESGARHVIEEYYTIPDKTNQAMIQFESSMDNPSLTQNDFSLEEHPLTSTKEGSSMGMVEELSTNSSQQKYTSSEKHLKASVQEGSVVMEGLSTDFTYIDETSVPMQSISLHCTGQDQVEFEKEKSSEDNFLIEMRQQSTIRCNQKDEQNAEIDCLEQENIGTVKKISLEEHVLTPTMVTDSFDLTKNISSAQIKQEQVELKEEISAEEKLLIEMREKSTTTDMIVESSADMKQIDLPSNSTQAISSIPAEQEQVESEQEISAEEKFMIDMREQSLTRDERFDEPSLKMDSPQQEVVIKETSSEEHLIATTKEESTTEMMEVPSGDGKQIHLPSGPVQAISSSLAEQEQVELEEEISSEEKLLIEMREQSLTRDERIDEPSLEMDSPQQEVVINETSSEEHLIATTKEESTTEMMEVPSGDGKQIHLPSGPVQAISSSLAEQEQVELEEEISSEEKLLIEMREQSLTRDERIDEPSLKMDSPQQEVVIKETSSDEHLIATTKEESTTEMMEVPSGDGKQIHLPSGPVQAISSSLAEQEQVELEEEISSEEKLLIEMREQSLTRDERIDEPSLKMDSPQQEVVIKETSSDEHLIATTKEESTTEMMEVPSGDGKQIHLPSGPVQAISSSLAEQEQVELEEEISSEEKLLIEMREQSLTRDERIDEPSLKMDSPQQEVVIKETSSDEHLIATTKEESTTEMMEVPSGDGKQIHLPSGPVQAISSSLAEQEQVELEEEISSEEKLLIEMREQSLKRDERIDEPSLEMDSPQQEVVINETSSEEHLIATTKEESTTDMIVESSADMKQIDLPSNSTQAISSIPAEQEQVESEQEISAEEKFMIDMREQSLTRDERFDEPSLKMDSPQQEVVIKETSSEEHLMTTTKDESTTQMMDEPSEEVKQIDLPSDPVQEQVKLEEGVFSEEKLLIETREQSLTRDERIGSPSLNKDSPQQEFVIKENSSEEHLMTTTKEESTTEIMVESSLDVKQIDLPSGPALVTSSILAEQEQVKLEEEISSEEKLLIEMREQSLTRDERIDEPSLKMDSPQQEFVIKENSSEEHLMTTAKEESTKEIMVESSKDVKQIDLPSGPALVTSSILAEQEQVKLEEEISSEEKLLIEMREQYLTRDERIDEPSLKMDSPQLEVVIKETSSEEHLMTTTKDESTTEMMEESSGDVKQIDLPSDPVQAISSSLAEQEQVELEEEISSEEKLLIEMREQSLTRDERIDEPSLKMDSPQQEVVINETSSEEHLMTTTKDESTTEMMEESSGDVKQIDLPSDPVQAISSSLAEQEQVELEEEISSEEKLLIEMREQSLKRDERIDEPSLKMDSPQLEVVIKETSSEDHLMATTKEESTKEIIVESSTDVKQIDLPSDPVLVTSSILAEQEQVELEEEISSEEKLLIEMREQSLTRDDRIDDPSLKMDSPQHEVVIKETSSEEHLMTTTKDESTTQMMDEPSGDVKQIDLHSDPVQAISSSLAEQEQVELKEEISSEEKLLIEMREQSLTSDERIDEPSLKMDSPQLQVVIKETSSEEHLMTSTKDESTKEIMIESSTDVKQIDLPSDPVQAISSILAEQEQVELEEGISSEEKLLIEMREQSLKRDERIDEPSLKMDSPQQEVVIKETSSEEHLMTTTKDESTTQMMDEPSGDVKQIDLHSDPVQAISSSLAEQEQVELEEGVFSEEKLLIETRDQSLTRDEHIDAPSLKMDSPQQEVVINETSSEEHLITTTKDESTTEMMEESSGDVKQIGLPSDPELQSISAQGFASILTKQENELCAVMRTESFFYENPANIQSYIVFKDAEIKYTILSEHEEKIHKIEKADSLPCSSAINIEQLTTQRLLIDSTSNMKSDNQNNKLIPTNDSLENCNEKYERNFDCFELLKLQDAERQYFEHIDNGQLCKNIASINLDHSVTAQQNAVHKMKDESNECIEKLKEPEVKVETSLAIKSSLSNSFAISTYLSELQRAETKYYEIKYSEHVNHLPQEPLTDSSKMRTNNEVKRLSEMKDTLLVDDIPVIAETKEEQLGSHVEIELPNKKVCLVKALAEPSLQARAQNSKKNVSFDDPVTMDSERLTSSDGLLMDNSTTGSDNIWNKGLLYSEVVAQTLPKARDTFSTKAILELNKLYENLPVQSSFVGDSKESLEPSYQKSSNVFNLDDSVAKSTRLIQEKEQDKYHASTRKDDGNDIILDSPVMEKSRIVTKDLSSDSIHCDSLKNMSMSDPLVTTVNKEKIVLKIEHTDNFDIHSLPPFALNESWLNKSVYDKAECLYYTLKTSEVASTLNEVRPNNISNDNVKHSALKSNNNLLETIIQPAIEDVDECDRQPKCAAKKLTIASSVLNVPMKQSIACSEDPETPKHPTEHHSLGSTNNVALNCSEQYDPDSTIIKQILPHGVENILESLLSAELKMNNLPYDNINDLIKGLQVLIEKLVDYKQQNYAISMSLPPNADLKIHESVRQIDDRIDFLRQRAHDGLEKIQQTLKTREQRKKEVQSYLLLLEEIESWISSSSIQLEDVDDNTSEDDINQMWHRNQNLLCNLTEKETKAKTIYAKMDEFLMYSDVCDRTILLKENLGVIIRTMREKTLILENNIQRLKQQQEPMASTMVNTEMQTSPPVSLEVFSRVPVEQQDTSSQTHNIGSTDNIIIIQSVSNGQETVQISNVRNTPLMGTSDDIIVEAKYTHPQDGEGKKSSELLLQNIPSQFESTFIEPDDSTTEIVVDKDGSKKITLRKTIQSTESIGPCEISSTSTLDAIVLPPVIEGTVLEVQNPKSVSEEAEVAFNIVGEILDHIQENVVFSVDKMESELVDTPEQDSQVFESDAHKVDLIASVVDSPSTSTVFSQQSTSEPYSNLTAKIDSKYNASVVEPIGDIWPPSESITTGVLGRSTKIDDTSTVRTIQSEIYKPDIISDEIWPQSLDTGSNYIDIAPQLPTLTPTNNESSSKQEPKYKEDINISLQNQNDESKSVPDTEDNKHEISVICTEYPIGEIELQVSSVIVGFPGAEEKLEEENLVTDIKNPSSDKKSVVETIINQLKPANDVIDHIISEVRSDVIPQETETKAEVITTNVKASSPHQIVMEVKRDCISVVESYESESKDEILTADVIVPPADQEERCDSILLVESNETDTRSEDIITKVETYCGDVLEQQTQTKSETDGKLEVQVASTKDEQSSLKLTMNIVSQDAKKISVSLIEVGHADSKTISVDDSSRMGENLPSKDLLTSEKIPGLSDIDYDKGYEADKTTVDGESGTDDSQKKKKRKKKKQRNETDKAINTDLLEPPVVPSESLEIGSGSERQEINITQEGIVNEPTETSSFIQERVIVSTEVIEAIYVEDVQQQTTPVEFEHPDFGLDQEVSKITSENLIVPIDLEQKSMQTSPEPETSKMSHQTSPIQTSVVECDVKEIQTAIQVNEIETQTLNTSPKPQTEQESQTDANNSECIDKSAATPVIDVVDMANQTIITSTAEMEIQTMENVSEIVEPLVTNIINLAVNNETIYKHHSIQTSPISFETSKEDVPVHHEGIQTIEPEILDAHVGTEQILREKATSPISQEATSDVQIQTSPIHERAIILENSDTPNAALVENVNQNTQTMIVSVVDNQVQTNSEPIANVSEVTIPCTDISSADKSSSKKSKKKMKKIKSDGKVPLQVEVSAQFEVPDSYTKINTFTISETILSDANVDPKGDIDIHVHMDIDPSSQRPESFRINEVISDDKIFSLGLHNYLSILKSQQNYAEHKKVPWNQVASVLENMFKTGNSFQTQYSNTLRATAADGENQDIDCLGLDRALHLLEENPTDATVQNQICFEILESISIPTEEIIADLNKYQNLNHTDCLRICQMHKQRLIYILKIIQRIICFITNNSTKLNPDVVKCFELTANELSQLNYQVSSLETKCQQKQVHIDGLIGVLHDVNAQFQSIDEKLSNIAYDETVSINKKLLELDELEQQYLDCAKRLRSISKELQTFKKNTFDSDLEAVLEAAEKKSRKLSHSVILERNKLNQLNSLAEEYEQTLLEFQDITEAAESFIKNNIVTNSLEELQEEMQRYRKFFVNLNHCKMILESLESNLDPITRQKHANLHSSLYHKTASILEKAVDKAAKLAQVASKWTILQKEMRNESQWLQIAQQRVPDLQNVSSEDFEQFITLYESLNQDIIYHHAKMMQQNEVAKKIQENVTAPILEKESNEALTVIVQLREEVSLYLNMLVKFKLYWNNYNNSADKLGEWICSCQKTLREIRIPSNLVDTSVEDMRNFWEIKAQYEVLNNKVYKTACDSFDRALSTINVSDEPLQRQLHGQLLENWLDVSSTISQIQTNISESMKTDSTTVGDKITFIEQELQEIAALFNNTKGVLKSHEDLYTYIEKIQMLRTRIHLIDSELGQIALGADSNTEKISDIFEVSRNVSHQINEEYEAAEIFFKCLEDIENGIKEEEINLAQISKILDSTHVNCKRPDVQKSLDGCIQCQIMLSDSWNKLMRLRQMLHTLPMNLKVSVSPLQTERGLSLLQTMHNDLEHRCGELIIQLKNRLTLWNKFHRQLEMIQDHIQETEFMMELMQLQENADYQRLLTATERLDALLIEIDSRKNTVEDLKSIAQPLIETSDENVSLEIQETVQKITVVWQNTRENLNELCQRYEKAVKLWQHYHDVCKNVKHWVEQEASDSDTIEYMNEISQLQIYQNLIFDKKKDLEQLKDLINNINVQVGFNVTGPLMIEIEDFSHKIQEIEENVISHKSNIESNNNQCEENQFVLNQAQQLFDKLQQNSQDPGFNTDMEIKIKHLREYMINLCATESRLEDILNGKQNCNLPDTEVKNLHLISQSLMQDSLEQYQNLIQKIILHGNDDNFINFWETYMMFVKTFLEQDISCNDTELRKLRNQYSLIAYLLKDFEALIMKKDCIDKNHAAKYKCLNQQHSENIIIIENRLVEIETRLRHWDNYNSIKSSLKEFMSYIEREKYSLQLEYISLKEISKMKSKVNALQVTFPQIEQDLDIMQREASEILTFTKDEHIMIQIRSDHGRLSQQASKLKESIETWIEFLSRIENLHKHYHSQCDQIQYNLVELTRCIEEVKIDNLGASQHHLNMLKNEQLRLAGVKDTLTNTNEIRDELKQRISIFDAKLIHQRLWQLWQMFEKLDYSLSVLLKQMQERLQNLKLFTQQYTILTNWMMEFENRINDSNKYQTCEDDATFIKSVEELLLQELLLKENEVEWFNIIGNDLVNNLQKGEEQLEIQTKLELLNSNWNKLKTHCHSRTQKIQEVNSTTISLQRRIEDIKAWMNKIEHDLKSPFMFESLNDSTLNKLMDQYDNLQRSIESNSGNVGEVLNLCEMLFTDVESWNVHIDRKHVLSDINNLEHRWKNICLESTKRKKDLFSIWNMLLEIEKIIKSHQEWVEKCNRYLDTVENVCQSSVNIENLSEILEELAIRNSDMIAQEPISHILRKLFVSLNKHERFDAANMRNVTTMAKKTLSVWECLLWRSNKLKKELCDLQTMQTTFINEYENIIMALTQIDVQVTNIKHLTGAPDDTPETKRKRLRDLHNELRFVINLFDKQDQLGTVLMEKISLPNSIQMKIQEYHDFANNIKISLDTLLSETIQESDKQKNQLSSQIQTEIFEKDSAVQVNTLPTLSHSKSITAKEAYQYQLESALVEARGHLENLQRAINEINVNNFMTTTQKVSKMSATCESSIELIKHLNLMVLSETQSSDEDSMSKLVNIECDKFTQYQTEWNTKQQKLEELSNDDYLTCPLCTNRNWQQIDNDLWRLEQWLQMAEANQKRQHTNPPTDIDTLEDTIQDHREFLLDLDSHKSIIKSLNIVGEHLATHTLDTEKAIRLRERLQADNRRWEKVCSQASHWQSLLHHALMDNKEFHRTVTELCTWLEQTENKIKSSEPIDLTSDMKLIERKYKTFRELRSDLVRCEPRVVSLQETTSQLTKYLEANKSQQFDEIYAKLTDLRLRFHSIRRLVEMYTIKIAAALGYDPTFETSSIASVDTQQEIQGVSGSLTRVAGQESNANVQEGEDEEDINTTVLTRSYRFLGRVVRASLPIQAMLLLLLGVVTLMPHGEDYSCTLTNNFARSLEPMLRYPNGPPPI